jgi:hypothetical protein
LRFWQQPSELANPSQVLATCEGLVLFDPAAQQFNSLVQQTLIVLVGRLFA